MIVLTTKFKTPLVVWNDFLSDTMCNVAHIDMYADNNTIILATYPSI